MSYYYILIETLINKKMDRNSLNRITFCLFLIIFTNLISCDKSDEATVELETPTSPKIQDLTNYTVL